jgi:predicted ribosome quality control (RQC) complex YloA/Tae2 family protein
MGVGVVDEECRGRLRDALRGGVSADQPRWRKHLEGGCVIAVERRGICVAHEATFWRIGAENAGALVLVAGQQAGQAAADVDGLDLSALGATLGEWLLRSEVGAWRDGLRRALSKGVARLDRRIDAIRGDLARMRGADEDAERARLFVAQAARTPRGATKLRAVDWSSGEARTVELCIDPARSAQEQLAAVFKRARRLKEGARIALERLADAEKAREALAALVAGVATCERADLDPLEKLARAAAPRDFRFESGASPGGSKPRLQEPRPPYRAFAGMSGGRILVGRGDSHNDALTFRVASPHHVWLHAKNRAGAHVIVPLDKGHTCPADLLVEAAHLAAHFSEARDEQVVEVQYTPRRYLRKPRGSPPGLVVVEREKVIVLRRVEAVLRRLLEREA